MSQSSSSNGIQNEGGCARFFMGVLAIFSPILGIAFSIIYRAMGNKEMANRLLAISLVVMGLSLVFVFLVWGTVLQMMLPFWEAFSFY